MGHWHSRAEYQGGFAIFKSAHTVQIPNIAKKLSLYGNHTRQFSHIMWNFAHEESNRRWITITFGSEIHKPIMSAKKTGGAYTPDNNHTWMWNNLMRYHRWLSNHLSCLKKIWSRIHQYLILIKKGLNTQF